MLKNLRVFPITGNEEVLRTFKDRKSNVRPAKDTVFKPLFVS